MGLRLKCYNCGKLGYFVKECIMENSGGVSFGGEGWLFFYCDIFCVKVVLDKIYLKY